MLNRPADGILRLPEAADGKIFREAWYGSNKLVLARTETGYTVELPEEDDGIDTVIRLTV